MEKPNYEEARRLAEQEMEDEEFNALVEEIKAEIRARKRFKDRVYNFFKLQKLAFKSLGD